MNKTPNLETATKHLNTLDLSKLYEKKENKETGSQVNRTRSLRDLIKSPRSPRSPRSHSKVISQKCHRKRTNSSPQNNKISKAATASLSPSSPREKSQNFFKKFSPFHSKSAEVATQKPSSIRELPRSLSEFDEQPVVVENPLRFGFCEGKSRFNFNNTDTKKSVLLLLIKSIKNENTDKFYDRFIQANLTENQSYDSVARHVRMICDTPIAKKHKINIWSFIKECYSAELRALKNKLKDEEGLSSFLRGGSVLNSLINQTFAPGLSTALKNSTTNTLNHLFKVTEELPIVIRESELENFARLLIFKKYDARKFEKCREPFFNDNLEVLKVVLENVLNDSLKATSHVPKKIKDVYSHFAIKCRETYPDKSQLAHQQIQGNYILRFLNPFLLEQMKELSITPAHHPRMKRAVISLCSLIQWVANELEEDSPKIPEIVKPIFETANLSKNITLMRLIVVKLSESD